MAEAGRGEGAMVIPIICQQYEVPAARGVLAHIAAVDRVVSARLFEVERSGTEIATNEKSMRTNDQSFPALLLVEALSDGALDAALDELRRTVGMATPLARYDQVFALDQHDFVDGLLTCSTTRPLQEDDQPAPCAGRPLACCDKRQPHWTDEYDLSRVSR